VNGSGTDAGTGGSKGTILAVDDTRASLKQLSDILMADGYQVRAVDSGELALASVVLDPPELILLDILMPGINGFDVLRWLKAREQSRDIPIVFLSALNETAQRVEGLKLGAVDFISKPFQPEELLARVQTHLELRRLRVRLEKQADELREALAKVKLLGGLLPICANCKKIRDDTGYWNQIEVYIRDHSEAVFSHGICPECTKVLYPGCSGK
jgi:PleD family two-component response regulator